MNRPATISSDVLATYAADAAREVAGVLRLVEGRVPGRRGVRVSGDDELRVELHLAVEWGTSIPDVGRAVQRGVRAYLRQMADVEPAAVDVIVDEIEAPA
jgi:uncharacterized alkaline shock family protein YloU